VHSLSYERLCTKTFGCRGIRQFGYGLFLHLVSKFILAQHLQAQILPFSDAKSPPNVSGTIFEGQTSVSTTQGLLSEFYGIFWNTKKRIEENG